MTASTDNPVSPRTDEWQPIATAPKNATEVLVIWPSERGWPKNRAMVAHWAQGGGEDQPRFGPAWFRWTGSDYAEMTPQPTHWMPLPAALPVTGAEASDAAAGTP